MRYVYLLIILMFVTFPCSAADYYISEDGAGDEDGSNVENAFAGWSDIQWDENNNQGSGYVGAGDTLYIIGTVKNTQFNIYSEGTSESQRLTIMSYSGDPGKIWKGYELDDQGWSTSEDYGTYYYKTYGIGTQSVGKEWESDPWSATSLINMGKVPDSDWTSETGVFYHDGTYIYYKPSDGILNGKTLTLRTGTDGSRSFQFSGKDYITISGLVLSGGMEISGSDYLTVEDCDIPGAVIVIVCDGGSQYGILRGNEIHDIDSGGGGFYAYNQTEADSYNHNNWIIEYNYIHNISGDGDSHGICFQGGSNNIIQYNNVYNCGTGITLWSQYYQTMKNNIIRFNRIYHMGYYGEDDGHGRGIDFQPDTKDADYITGNLIYGNVVSDCYDYGEAEFDDGVGIFVQNGYPTSGYAVKVINNTVYDCDKSFYFSPSAPSGECEIGAYLYNNISLSPKENGHHIYLARTSCTQTYRMAINKNIYYGDGSFYHGKDDAQGSASTWISLSDWISGMAGVDDPIDDNSDDSDPKFTDPSNGIFTLQGDSPAINGTDLGDGSTYGVLNPSSQWPNAVGVLNPDHFGWPIGAYPYLEVSGTIIGNGE